MRVFVLRLLASLAVFTALMLVLWKLKMWRTMAVVGAGGLVVAFLASWFVFGQLTFLEKP